jgi:hypothetical protein
MPLVIVLAGVSLTAAAEWARERTARRRLPEQETIESVLASH